MASTGEMEAMVDPFLVEALQNPRHRLTILRMELDVQRSLQDADQPQFEFQHFPTSYLRLAAHRVAQHYGLVTMVQDCGADGFSNRILVRKTAESKYPSVRLSEIPAKQPENSKPEVIKIAIKPRPGRGSVGDGTGRGAQHNPMRSVEERKEEYDKARARIFSSPNSSDSEDSSSQGPVQKNYACLNRNKNELAKSNSIDAERSSTAREAVGASRIAIIRDREKDRFDPDYDRSYERYVRVMPSGQNFNPSPIQIPFHDAAFPQIPRTQAALSYRHPLSPAMSPFCNPAINQTPRNIPTYAQWPSAAMVYVNSYEQLGNVPFQGPFCPQPLSVEYLQNR